MMHLRHFVTFSCTDASCTYCSRKDENIGHSCCTTGTSGADEAANEEISRGVHNSKLIRKGRKGNAMSQFLKQLI